jgi:DNA (cytosine-5)-methyltransferase 1
VWKLSAQNGTILSVSFKLIQSLSVGYIMIKAIDFFCGAGGLTRGLLNTGIKVLAGIDNDERLRETYESNNAPSRFIHQGIEHININQLRKGLAIQDTDLVLYAACTPCQPFSTLNKLKGKDDRKFLLLVFAKLVEESPPDFILVENVPGLNNAYGKEIYQQFMKILRKCRFSADADLLDAKHYGIPQTRKRFILLASRHGLIQLPQPVFDSKSFATVRRYIERYPAIPDGGASKEYPNHASRRLQPHHKRIVKAVPPNGGSRLDISDTSILLKCHQKNPNAHKDVFGRMAWDEPAPTLTCRCTDVYCGRFIHPEQHRGISLREAAALQTFKDDYKFFGTSFLFMSTQIGNAVPVKLGETLGESLINSL